MELVDLSLESPYLSVDKVRERLDEPPVLRGGSMGLGGGRVLVHFEEPAE